MTSPAGPDDTTRRLTAAATATGPNRPGLAVSLAQSDLSESEIQSVGGFVDALQLSVARRLATNSGARIHLTAAERSQLEGIGEVVAEEESEDDSRSWFEKATDWAAGALSNTGNFLVTNPVSDAVLDGFEWLGNAAKMPFRVLSDQVDAENDDEMRAGMDAQGYDTESTTSYLAFMFSQGDSQFHDLSTVRDVFGDEHVDLAIQMHSDPEQFQRDFETMAPEDAARLNETLNSSEFRDAFDAVDRRHISPGRDLARLLLPQGEGDKSGFWTEDGALFTALSGSLDAAYLWFTDPTLILGKANKVIKAADALGRDATLVERFLTAVPFQKNRRAGLAHMTDQAGIEALLRVDEATGEAVTKVGKGWQRYLEDAADLRAADAAGDEAKRAGIYAVMEQRYGVLMDMLPEINGARVIADAGAASGFRVDNLTNAHLINNGGPIEDLDELAKHLVSTNGLLRLNNGMAAREVVVMPGRLSWRAERTAAVEAKTLLTRRNKADKVARWIDYSRPDQLLPNEAEQKLLDEAMDPDAVRAGLAQRNLLLKTSILHARAARAKVERVARRFTTQIPKVERLDLGDPSSAKLVEQIARMYLNRGDAAKLASAYALAPDLAAKRAVARGVLTQVFHASGLSRSEAGRNFMERFIGDQSILARQQYGYAKTSEIATNRGNVQVALYPDQISRTVILPSMREMHYLATKFAVGGFAGRSKLAHVRGMTQSDGMDSMIGLIKLGWITSAAGGLRNALDEIANFAAYGMGKDVLAARVAFTQATKDLRAERRAASKERRELIRTLGRTEADDRIASRLGEGLKSHEDAALEVERARKAQAAIDDVESKLHERVTNANVARAEAFTYRYRALDEFEKAKKAKLPEEELAPLRERATYWSDEVAKADGVIKQHEKAYANRATEQDAVRQKFADRGVLTVDEADAALKAAKAELERAQNLQVAISHRIPYALRWAADTVNDVFVGAVLGKAMSVFGKDWAITGDRVKWANELVDRELSITFRDGIFQAHHADTELVHASDAAAMDYHRAGLMARKYSFRSNGWGQIEMDGGAGLTAWAKTLQLRFADTNSPAHSFVQTLHGLWKPSVLDDKGKVVSGMSRADMENALDAARESVLRRLDDEDMRHFVGSAEIFQWYKGEKIAKGDEEILALAKAEYADRVSADLAQALGREGTINKELLDELAAGRVPDRSWLAQLDPKERPAHAIGQLWAPYNPAMQPGQITRGMTGVMVKAYDKVVTDQINALSRNPLVTALYMRARENTQGYVKHLVDEGWDPEIADDIGRRIAAQHAEVEALKHIDNPYVSSQFSMMSRNMFAFVRAQEDWLRRWGRTIKDNPELIRKAQLLIHGGESVGFLEQDDEGELHFVYPGSSLMLGVFGSFFGAMNQPNGARIPMSKELSSQITFVNPSLDNPLALSGTPLISLPWKAISHFMGPDNALMSASIDKVINGELGAGREWWEQLLPSWANRIIGGVLPTEDMGSKYGAAIQSTLANMEAAGMLADPKYQTPEGQAELLHALQVGTHNDLLSTALFGFFLPAAPMFEGGAAETAEGFQGNDADWSAHIQGLRSLKDEARQIFSRLPYEEAKAWWMEVHPNESILAPTGAGSRTTVGADNASAPATIAAASYLQHNTEFFGQYGGKGGAAAYLIPQGPAGTVNGEYSDVAYRAQLELGIRDHKTLDEYFSDIVTARGYQQYFAAKDDYDTRKAQVAGSPGLNARLDAEWGQTRAQIMAGNPLLAARLAENAVDNAMTGSTMQSLYRMVNDESPSTLRALGPNRDGVVAMLAAKEQHDQAIDALDDRRGASANRRRAQIKTNYDSQIQTLAAQFPGLADLARGVFRSTS